MKIAYLVSFAFLSASISVAQTSGQSFGTAGMENLARPNQTPVVATAGQGCPVALHALHGSSGNILKVDKNKPAGIAQLLRLVVTAPDSRQIVAGKVTARGISGKGRVAQAEGSPDQADTTKNLDVRFAPESGRDVAGEVWVPGVTAVMSVRLDSVTFADGSTWRFAGREACRVVPDPLMLIAGR